MSKRRTNVTRYPSGQIRHINREPRETAAQITATVLGYRRKQVGERQAGNPAASTAHGRLWLTGRLDIRQYRAGEEYAALVCRYRALMGEKPPHAASPVLESGRAGGKPTPDIDDTCDEQRREDYLKRVASVRSEYQDAFASLTDADWTRRLHSAVNRVLFDGVDENALSDAALGELRVGLNVLARHFELTSARKSVLATSR